MEKSRGYQAFCNYVKDKSFSLIGLGVSNLPLVSFLYQAGAKIVVVRDLKKKTDDQEVLSAIRDGASVILGADYLNDINEDVIIRSPGIRPDITPFLQAAEKGSRITCETELFLEFVPCKTFAITGSDGKTTTTTLVSKLLSSAGYSVHLGGNIGKAMLPQLLEITDDEKHIAVMELSSFQLMQCAFSPDVAIITNLSENHLDWHTDMGEYLEAKTNILLHQNENAVAVLNFDNVHTKACGVNGKRIYFSYFEQPEGDAVYYNNGAVYAKMDGNVTQILQTKDILLPGKHNVENYMAAIAATFNFIQESDAVSVAKTFGGVEHRIELVRELDGVKYYNSSIDSSPARSKACLNAFNQKVIMIAGGYDKNLDYTELGDLICNKVKTLILCGATSEKIKTATNGSKYYNKSLKIIECKEFSDTVTEAKKIAESGDCVVLSPASASFDLFRNFEERGKYFKKLVMEL